MTKGKGLIIAGIIFMLSGGVTSFTHGAYAAGPFVVGLALILVGRKKLREEGGTDAR